MGRVAVSADHHLQFEDPSASAAFAKHEWCVLGTVLGLRRRQPGSVEPTIVTSLEAIAGVGLSNDSHADPLSPRQVLLAGSDAYDELALPSQALRENVLLDFPTNDLPSAAVLQIGNDVLLRTTFQCEPCGRLEGHHPGVLRRIGSRRGILARVIRSGRVQVGDSVRCRVTEAVPLSDSWQERLLQVMDRVPHGRVVEYRQLAKLAGVPKVYCRVFTKVLAKAAPDVGAKARPGSVDDELRRWTGQELHQRDDEVALEELF